MNWILAHQFFVLLDVFVITFVALFLYTIRLQKKVTRLLGGIHQNETYQIIHRMIEAEEKIKHIEPCLAEIEKAHNLTIQKVGFLRFNPFDSTGGDNSFVLTLLDKENNGILISSLYMREGMRLYGKKVEAGKTRYPLLDEEKKVLEEAIRK